ncbi:MAG TPA: ABC transporter substrate-binding protein [Streptosporangiaceae bacterium]|nr:ABC transporter substrate-binding protein [Streptosporangiaceae bacterium]
MRARYVIAAGAAIASTALLTAACSSSSSSSLATTGASSASSSAAAGSGGGAASVSWATVTSAQAAGGMNALIAEAKKEGQLNVITLPRNWANYGAIMDEFTKLYGIKITDANPDGTSQDELNAIAQLKGQDRAPDVVDVGTAFAVTGQQDHDWAPYQVATWNDIPAAAKAADGAYYADYGGYVAIGYDPAKVKVAPTSFKDLLKPMYKNEVALNGSPTEAGAAFAGVYAAALANGGSLDNIAPGVDYFKKLHQAGNFVPVTGSAATMQSGQTPILIWWDYLLASEVQPTVKDLKVVIPSDSNYAGYYDQAISSSAPHPAAARLWEEFLYSAQGQNLFLQGEARPIELAAMDSAGSSDKTAEAALPQAPSSASIATVPQITAAKAILTQQWPSVTG